MKTNKAVRKRFHVTKGGKGKLMALQIGIRHGRTKLSRKKIRSKKGLVDVKKGDGKLIQKFLPYGGKS